MKKNKMTNLFLMSLLALLSLPSSALESDKYQPINIEADRAEFDRKAGTANYIGNVVLQQGSLIIYADKISLIREGEELQEAIATGKPARFQQQLDDSDALTKARSQTMRFDTNKQKVTLLKEAFLKQGDNSFSGEQIIYDTEKERVSARATPTGETQAEQSNKSGRIKLIIQPNTLPKKN